MGLNEVFIAVFDLCRAEDRKEIEEELSSLVGPKDKLSYTNDREFPGIPGNVHESFEYDEEVGQDSLNQFESVVSFIDADRSSHNEPRLYDITTIAQLSETQLESLYPDPMAFLSGEADLIWHQRTIESIHKDLSKNVFVTGSNQTSSTITIAEFEEEISQFVIEEDAESGEVGNSPYPDLTEIDKFFDRFETDLKRVGMSRGSLLSLLPDGALISHQLITNEESRQTVITGPIPSTLDGLPNEEPPQKGKFKIHDVQRYLRDTDGFRRLRHLHNQNLWSRWCLSKVEDFHEDVEDLLDELTGLQSSDFEQYASLNSQISTRRSQWLAMRASLSRDKTTLGEIHDPTEIRDMDLQPIRQTAPITLTGSHPGSLLKGYQSRISKNFNQISDLWDRIEEYLQRANDHVATQTEIKTVDELRQVQNELNLAQQDTISVLNETKNLSEETGKLQKDMHQYTKYLLVIGILQAIVAMVQLYQIIPLNQLYEILSGLS